MKSIFDPIVRDEVIGRIQALNETAPPQWGKMTVYQMLKHCTLWEDMMQGKVQFKRMFLGWVFGKMALKAVLKDDSPLRLGTPTLAELTTVDKSGNITAQKGEWIAKIQAYAHFSHRDLVHPFFGKMTEVQIGLLVYKHIDHHLRQFNA